MHFIDPSMVDDFWKDAAAAAAHFASFGLDNVRHHLHTTQQFVTIPEYQSLVDIGLLFIDGYHTAEQARFDYMDELRQDPGLQLLDLPYGTGLTVLRKLDGAAAEPTSLDSRRRDSAARLPRSA